MWLVASLPCLCHDYSERNAKKSQSLWNNLLSIKHHYQLTVKRNEKKDAYQKLLKVKKTQPSTPQEVENKKEEHHHKQITKMRTRRVTRLERPVAKHLSRGLNKVLGWCALSAFLTHCLTVCVVWYWIRTCRSQIVSFVVWDTIHISNVVTLFRSIALFLLGRHVVNKTFLLQDLIDIFCFIGSPYDASH